MTCVWYLLVQDGRQAHRRAKDRADVGDGLLDVRRCVRHSACGRQRRTRCWRRCDVLLVLLHQARCPWSTKQQQQKQKKKKKHNRSDLLQGVFLYCFTHSGNLKGARRRGVGRQVALRIHVPEDDVNMVSMGAPVRNVGVAVRRGRGIVTAFTPTPCSTRTHHHAHKQCKRVRIVIQCTHQSEGKYAWLPGCKLTSIYIYIYIYIYILKGNRKKKVLQFFG